MLTGPGGIAGQGAVFLVRARRNLPHIPPQPGREETACTDPQKIRSLPKSGQFRAEGDDKKLKNRTKKLENFFIRLPFLDYYSDVASQNSCVMERRSLSFSEAEHLCEMRFAELLSRYGKLWHICTPGLKQEIINSSEEDFKFAVSNMAISAAESGLIVLTDAQMDNHLHVLAAGKKEKCLSFLEPYRFRLSKYLQSKGRYIDLSSFRCDDPIEVTDLGMARNEIAYINRNGFIANRMWTPFTYPWGSGFLYFNRMMCNEGGVRYNDLPFREKRRLSCRRVSEMPERYIFYSGMIWPSGYASIRDGESLFRDAHHYYMAISRNYEAYGEAAKRLGDMVVVTDEEMYNVGRMISQRDHKGVQPSLLAPDDKIKVAREMHGRYNATNAQVRRILKLPSEIVDSLFP